MVQRLTRMTPALTIVMIAHRVESLACCDKILLVVAGHVTEVSGVEALRAALLAGESGIQRERDGRAPSM